MDAGTGTIGGVAFGFGVSDDGATGFADTEFVHEELDAFGDFWCTEAFFQISEGAVVTADDFVIGGTSDGFVVGDTFADDVDAHVGGGVVDVFASDAVEDFF